MLVLAVDTSTPFVTAGVCRLTPRDAGAEIQTLAMRVTEDARAHAELLTPYILECLTQADVAPYELDAVVVGTGPGPFTGLRVGMVTAAAFADALGRPVHGICSLDGLAARARAAGATGDLVVVTDARRREAYHARYSPDGDRISGPTVGPAADIEFDRHVQCVGDPVRLREVSSGRGSGGETAVVTVAPGLESVTAPDPAGLVTVAAPDLLAGVTPAPLEPLYLRRPDAVPPRRIEPSSALQGVVR